jgi:hypothetical protein
VILATGIRERPRSARLVPGLRPERGVVTTGQLQQMVARGVPVGGRRAVVVGTEHVAFSVLVTARRAGLAVVAMVGAEDRVMSWAGAGWAARALGVPIHLASAIADVEGRERVEGVVVEGPAGTQRIACDTLVFTGDFTPDAALLPAGGVAVDRGTGGPVVDQYGRTDAAGVFAAGNLLRAVESSGRAAIEGARVGAVVAAYLAGDREWPLHAAALRTGDSLAYVMPQRWSIAAGSDGGLTALPVSLRSRVDLRRGRLRLAQGGTVLWSGPPVAALRQRRIRLPAAALAALRDARDAEIALDAA